MVTTNETPRRRNTRLNALLSLMIAALVITIAGTNGLVRALRSELDGVKRESVATTALSEAHPDFENYLFVGSDSRAGSDPSDPDYNNVGAEGDIGGQRSDTLMVMHYVKATGTVSLLSIPRDLWVYIGDGDESQRVNTAYQLGTDVLVRTVQRALGIPIHHYVEINFQGFKTIVDSVGGVSVCVDHASRDKHTGLFMRPGCSTLDGVEALAFARSRFFEQKIDGDWQVDGSSDIGRTARQRLFVQALAKSAVLGVSDNPFSVGNVVEGALSAVIVDDQLDLIEFGKKMRPAASGKIASFPLAVYGDTIAGNSVLQLGEDAAELLSFFAGTGPRPVLNP
jgi:LCP family protein required for cell wall assembly